MKKEVEELTGKVAKLEAELKEREELFMAKEQGYLLQAKDLQQKVFSILLIHTLIYQQQIHHTP